MKVTGPQSPGDISVIIKKLDELHSEEVWTCLEYTSPHQGN